MGTAFTNNVNVNNLESKLFNNIRRHFVVRRVAFFILLGVIW